MLYTPSVIGANFLPDRKMIIRFGSLTFQRIITGKNSPDFKISFEGNKL